MNFDIALINGLVFGIAHTGALYIEDEEEEDLLHEGQGIVIYVGFFQIVIYW